MGDTEVLFGPIMTLNNQEEKNAIPKDVCLGPYGETSDLWYPVKYKPIEF